MIFEWNKMEKLTNKNYLTDENHDMPVFCEKHRVIGSLAFRQGGDEMLIEKKKSKNEEKKVNKD